MKTYTTKIAKNGATLYYSTETGKRIAKETALENERNYILTNGTVKERYELAKENFRFNERGEVERLWFHDVVSYGNRYNFKITTKYEWYVVSDKDADYALQKYCRMTLAEFRAEAEVETEENVEATEQVVEVKAETKKTCKNYSLNPVIDENSPLKLNHLNIFINGGNLKFDGTFECKKLETAYRRFTKIMEQASRDIPELEGWGKDSWGEVKKFTENEFGWENEDGDIVLYHEGGENTLAVDINEDYFYIWGNFPDAFEVTEQVAEVSTVEEKTEASEYKPQTSWENPHDFSTVGDLDTDRYLAARNHFTTIEDLLPELSELETKTDAVNEQYLRVGFTLYVCNHFSLNKARQVLFPIRNEYRAEAAKSVEAVENLYKIFKVIDCNAIIKYLSIFEYVHGGINVNEAQEIFVAIRDNLGDQALASELTKLADEFGIDRALLLQSDDCRFNPALFTEKSKLPELTGRMKWAAELLDNYTYEFEGDWEAGNGGLARHYKRFNRYGEHVGKLVEVFTDKTSFILDHVNIVVKSIRTYYYINGEQLSYLNGEFTFVWSDKYKAGMTVVGGEHLQVEVPDGQWKKYKNFMVNNDEFFQIMSERGACTIAEENRKLDEAFTESESPATFNVGKTYLAERCRAGDELATFKILGRSAKFVTAVPVAFADWGETKADNDYVFQRRIYRDDFGDEYFMEPDNQIAVRASKAYQFDEPEVPMVVEPAEPPVDTFTAKRDRLIAERDAAMDFMEDAVDEMRERIDLPDEVLEVKTMKDSLERAMKFALERHEGFVKLGQMTAAENEMKLYAICRNALAALK